MRSMRRPNITDFKIFFSIKESIWIIFYWEFLKIVLDKRKKQIYSSVPNVRGDRLKDLYFNMFKKESKKPEKKR